MPKSRRAWKAYTEDASDRLVAHHVVAGRVNDIADVLGDPHMAARAAIATVNRHVGRSHAGAGAAAE